MSRSLTFVIFGACALGGALLFPSTSHAQRPLWGEDAWRSATPGAVVPYGGKPVVERYGYPDTELFLWGNYRQTFWTIYEIDRQERYEAFGTRYGPDHPPLFNRVFHKPHWPGP
jgi:hypothetical protein